MQEDEPINPYAAPQTQLIHPGAEAARRPASVKWATFVFGFNTLGMVVLFGQIVSEHGMQSLWNGQVITFGLLLPFSLSFSLFGGRHKVAYYVNAGVLASMAIMLTWTVLFYRWGFKEMWVKIFLFDRCMEAFWLYVIWYLFYRFTFGLPSRSYFGFAQRTTESTTP